MAKQQPYNYLLKYGSEVVTIFLNILLKIKLTKLFLTPKMYYQTWTEKIMCGLLENINYKVSFYILFIKHRVYERNKHTTFLRN